MYKQDSDYMKNTIKARYNNRGRSATESVSEEQVEESSPEAIAKINQITRR